MEFLQLMFAFLLGAALVLSGLLLLPKMIDRLFLGKKRTFEIVFRTIYYQQPSMFSSDTKGSLVKSPLITVKIIAPTEKDALHTLDDIIKEEIKGELIKIKDITNEKKPDRPD